MKNPPDSPPPSAVPPAVLKTKKNSERNWHIEFLGFKPFYHNTTFRGTVEAVLAKADEEECEIDWEVKKITISAIVKAKGVQS